LKKRDIIEELEKKLHKIDNKGRIDQQNITKRGMEKEIKLASKLYKCRDTAKKFFRDEYSKKLESYTFLLETVMKDHNLDAIPALLRISELEAYKENGMAQMMFMAATVELIEPSV